MASIGAVFGTNLYKTGTTNFTAAELKNANQDWQDISGSGIPADGATVGAVFGTNLYKTGTTNFTAAELKNDQIALGLSGTGLTLTNAGSGVTLAKANVGLNLVDNTSDNTIRAGNFTGTINSVAVATVTTGAAAGATANQDSTGTILGGTHTGAVSGNVTGTVNSVAVATVTSGAALGTSSNQDSTATIRNGVTTYVVNKGTSIVWSNLSGNMTPNDTTYDWTITWRNGSGTSLGTTVIRASLNGTTALAIMTTQSNGASATVNLGGAVSSGNLQTTTVTLNSIVVTLTAKIIDGSGWSFK